MFRTLRQLFRRKPTPATKRVMEDIERRRALSAHDENRTIAEQVAHLDKSRAVQLSPDGIDLDADTRERIHRKQQNAKPTPIWPADCRLVACSPHGAQAILRDIFAPNPVPTNVVYIITTESGYGFRNRRVMVLSNADRDLIIGLHMAGAILIDPWGKALDMTGADDDTPALKRGRDMAEAARKREAETLPPVVWPEYGVTPLQAADLPDFHSCRYAEDPQFEGGGGSFGGGGASGGWDENNQTNSVTTPSDPSPSYTPDSSGSTSSYDSSPSSDSSSSYSDSSSSSDSGSSGGSDGW